MSDEKLVLYICGSLFLHFKGYKKNNDNKVVFYIKRFMCKNIL